VRARLLGLGLVASGLGLPLSAGCHNIYVPGEATPGTGEDGGPSLDGGTGDAGDAGWVPTGPDKPGCAGLLAQCSGADCCTSALVPGGTFDRANDPTFPATLSPFRLDVYEVVVGRFRAWVNAGQGTQQTPPVTGSGADPNVPGSGWLARWNALLPEGGAALREGLKCSPEYPVWSDYPGANEDKPINCVNWYQALAFCAWDGGWIPTEAQWNFAAAGGDEQRVYPSGASIDATTVNYTPGPCGPCVDGAGKPLGALLAPGSKPAGRARWGHADMAGNVWEWTMDAFRQPYDIQACTDCADLAPSGVRSLRGGGFNWDESFQMSSHRGQDPPERVAGSVGFRCARRP
jgi:formylglycine-generating enzyme required for sulfatase activity